MAVLIDTSVLIEFERADAGAELELLVGPEDRSISVVTASELLHGALRATGARRTCRLAFVEHVLSAFAAIPITTTVARVHAEIWSELAAKGEVIGAHDLWIAASALAHGLGVVTSDGGDFARVPGLRVIAV